MTSDSRRSGTNQTATPDNETELDPLVTSEVQILLAEKRTSLALLRTAIAVLVLPMSVFTFLIATSNYYKLPDTIHIFVPLVALNAGLVCLGFYLVARAIVRIRRHDRMLEYLKQKHSVLSGFMD